MVITRWNEASRALPVLALKSNYLDRWLNDCSGLPRLLVDNVNPEPSKVQVTAHTLTDYGSFQR